MSPRLNLKFSQRDGPTLTRTCARFFVTGREVVETDDALVEQQQRFHQIAADEAGSSGDEPGAGLGFERFLQRIECGHHSLQRVKPAAFTAAGS